MRVWIITVGEPLPCFSGESRLWRSGWLATTLAERGHEVTWWTSSVDHFHKRLFVVGPAAHEVTHGLTIRFLHGCLYRRNVSLRRLINHRQLARGFISQVADMPTPDVIVSSFPTIELCAEASRYGRTRGVPVFLDIRDLWPDELVARVPPVLRPVARLLVSGMSRQARRAIASASGIIAVSNTYLAWALKQVPRSRSDYDRVFPLGYASTKVANPDPSSVDRFLRAGIDPGRKIFWFCGTFVGHIDLSTVIESARLLKDAAGIQFVFTGTGERLDEWRAQARELENVVFTGWADSRELGWLASIAWAGLASYTRGTKVSLPNKIFEYAHFRLPILVSLGGEARRLVVGEQMGLAYEPGNARDLSEKIMMLVDDEAERERLAHNAVSRFRESFAAEIVYGNYSDFLEERATGKKCTTRARLALARDD